MGWDRLVLQSSELLYIEHLHSSYLTSCPDFVGGPDINPPISYSILSIELEEICPGNLYVASAQV